MKGLPNFFVVGAAKAGTTSLYYYLKQHPEIYMSPIKEPNFFAKDIEIEKFRPDIKKMLEKNYSITQSGVKENHIALIRDINSYLQLFRNVKDEKAIGEMSTAYLYSKVAPIEIKRLIPKAKIIMILRNPIERAYSHYLMNLRDGLIDTTNFVEEVLTDYKKPLKGWGVSHLYIEMGLYYEQVKRYLEVFGKQQVLILLYDDYRNNLQESLNRIFNFLEVENIPFENFSKKELNKAAIPRFPKFNKAVKRIYLMSRIFIPKKIKKILKNKYKRTFLKQEIKEISSTEKRILLEYIIDDIEKLSTLLNLDLSNWKK